MNFVIRDSNWANDSATVDQLVKRVGAVPAVIVQEVSAKAVIVLLQG
jgi:hypothetical protein